jgi:hypothetical protein
VTNYKGEPHAQTVVTLNVKKNDCSELIEQEEVDEFDFKTAGVFSKINTDKLIKE